MRDTLNRLKHLAGELLALTLIPGAIAAAYAVKPASELEPSPTAISIPDDAHTPTGPLEATLIPADEIPAGLYQLLDPTQPLDQPRREPAADGRRRPVLQGRPGMIHELDLTRVVPVATNNATADGDSSFPA